MNLTKITASIDTHKVVRKTIHINNVSLQFSLVKFITLKIKKFRIQNAMGRVGRKGRYMKLLDGS